jgi:hypothetical protein
MAPYDTTYESSGMVGATNVNGEAAVSVIATCRVGTTLFLCTTTSSLFVVAIILQKNLQKYDLKIFFGKQKKQQKSWVVVVAGGRLQN